MKFINFCWLNGHVHHVHRLARSLEEADLRELLRQHGGGDEVLTQEVGHGVGAALGEAGAVDGTMELLRSEISLRNNGVKPSLEMIYTIYLYHPLILGIFEANNHTIPKIW